jgi:hypothetical protein
MSHLVPLSVTGNMRDVLALESGGSSRLAQGATGDLLVRRRLLVNELEGDKLDELAMLCCDHDTHSTYSSVFGATIFMTCVCFLPGRTGIRVNHFGTG